MRKFNTGVIVLWLMMFGVTCIPTHTNYEDHDWHDEVVYQINSAFESVVRMPTKEIVNAPRGSEKRTILYLQITFFYFVFFVLSLKVMTRAKDGWEFLAATTVCCAYLLSTLFLFLHPKRWLKKEKKSPDKTTYLEA